MRLFFFSLALLLMNIYIYYNLARWILRIVKIQSISRSTSQSSFYSCTEDIEDNDNNDEEYTWKTPALVIHNIVFGHLWCEFQGQIELIHTQSNQKAILTIKSHSWFASQATKTADMFKYSGFIYDGMYILQFFFYIYSITNVIHFENVNVCVFFEEIS
jgi:hypothetical protein